MKRRIERARLVALVLVVLVAASGTAAATLASSAAELARWLAAAAAVGSALLPVLRPAWSGTRLRDWTRVRSVSEALKSDVYLWLARAGDFAADSDGVLLQDRTDRLRRDAADLLSELQGVEPQDRPLPQVRDARTFFDIRVGEQIDDYYQPRADRIRRVMNRFRILELILGLVGAVMGVAAAVAVASIAAWVAVVATIGTAVAAHVAAAGYDYQRVEFLRTAERLRQLRRAAESAGRSETELSAMIVQAEEVISVENQGWMAKLAEDPPGRQAATPGVSG
jgi:hypothetical protein